MLYMGAFRFRSAWAGFFVASVAFGRRENVRVFAVPMSACLKHTNTQSNSKFHAHPLHLVFHFDLINVSVNEPPRHTTTQHHCTTNFHSLHQRTRSTRRLLPLHQRPILANKHKLAFQCIPLQMVRNNMQHCTTHNSNPT